MSGLVNIPDHQFLPVKMPLAHFDHESYKQRHIAGVAMIRASHRDRCVTRKH